MDELKKILDIDISISLTPEQWSAVLEQVASETTLAPIKKCFLLFQSGLDLDQLAMGI